MSAVVALPGVLRAHVGGAHEVNVEVGSGTSLRELLVALGDEHPALTRRICDEQGELRRFVNVYVDDRDVRDVDGLDTHVADGARLLVLPSVAGGGH